MNEYLMKIQAKTLNYDVKYIFDECKRRYKAAALLVGHYDDFIKKLDESNTNYYNYLWRIVWEIYDRYNKNHSSEQLEIFEPYEDMVERRWYTFISKIRKALVEDDTFCRCYLRIAYFFNTSKIGDEFEVALQIAKDIDLRWYLSDEPMKMDEEEKYE